MPHDFKDRLEWELDLLERQRNIVFPDTAFNEGRFYRNLVSRRFDLVHWIGVVVLIGMSLIPTFVLFLGALSDLASGNSPIAVLLRSLPMFFMPGLLVYILLLAIIRQIARKPDQN